VRPKPLLIKRAGRGRWHLFDKGVPVTKGSDGKPSLPDRPNYVPGAEPYTLDSKEAAQSLAHMLGKYIRKYGGDLVFGYTAIVDEAGNPLKD